MMSFFPAPFCAPAASTADASFNPLFRLLEDFDNYSRQAQAAPSVPECRRQRTTQPRRRPATFNPKFDIRETENTYELHGELPGLDRENVNIEFTEPDTMVIRGHVERSYGSESNNNATTEETTTESTTETAISEETAAEDFTKIEKPRSNSLQATVEDDPEEATPASTPASSPKPEVAKPAAETRTQPAETQTQPAQGQPRYRRWERSVGEFARAFTFSTLVDHDAVTASLNNGILTVTVPKAAKPAMRRIEIISY
jgi:HSP20 family molecular chaperone IbpA